MTNKLEIDRELAESLLKCLEDAAVCGYPSPCEAQELRALLAAPVVERQEPVACAPCDFHGVRCSVLKDCNTSAFGSTGAKVQTAPVAVVLPDRFVHEHSGCFLPERQHGWNACLDKVKELNQ